MLIFIDVFLHSFLTSRIFSEGNVHRVFLEILQWVKKDSGLYKITGKNVKGDGSTAIQLNIEGIDFRFVQ